MNVIFVFSMNGSFPGIEGIKEYFLVADASKICIIHFL